MSIAQTDYPFAYTRTTWHSVRHIFEKIETSLEEIASPDLTLEYLECFFKDDINIVNGKLCAAWAVLVTPGRGLRYAWQASAYTDIVTAYIGCMEGIVAKYEKQEKTDTSMNVPVLKEFVASVTRIWVQTVADLAAWTL